MRYAKANNHKVPDYNDTKPKSWLIYQDCNNLYGWAMAECMPSGGFKWVEAKLDGINDLDDNSPIGRMYEVDVAYPVELHDQHNDLPFLPQNGIPEGSKFNQSPWLPEFINLNTEMRKKALNDFEKDFFKLMNNSIFDKTMEQVRRRIQMELVSNEDRVQKLINMTTFKYATSYNENLSGLAVLDISKTLMYDYHYVMKAHYGDKIELMYTDTDSLLYYIHTDDFYEDLAKNANLLNRMDTSNLPRDNPCYIAERKKIPGLFLDETDGRVMTEFCALRAKSYAYKIQGVDDIKVQIRAKGVRGHVVKHHMTFEGHRRCLFEGMDPVINNRQLNMCIRSFKHQLTTVQTNKIIYNNYDDKRVVLQDKVHTLAHGHYSLKKDDWPELYEEGNWNEEEKGLMRDLLHFIT
ncbi:hypothetical protein QTP88_011659 [Uroleucon formosanum]